jgi:hypothetical protein
MKKVIGYVTSSILEVIDGHCHWGCNMNCKHVILLSCLALLSGCASVIEGQSQDVVVNTTPPGATCTFVRNNASLGTITSTPGTMRVEKTKDDISIKCDKAGYQQTTYLNKSGYPEYNWAYILVGGPIGWGFDSATGADNEYASPVTIDLLH